MNEIAIRTVLPVITRGMIEPSAMRRLSIP
jgi:hypothetical protein